MSVTSPLDPAAAALRWPFRLTIALLGVVFVLILMGAMVTSTGSGMAFLDWPYSDGELMPERAFTEPSAFLEHFHRVIGALAGMMVLGLAFWLQLGKLGSPGLRKAVWGGVGLISLQGAIGGIHVLKGAPALTAAIHGTLAQITIASFAVIAYAMSQRWRATVCGVHPSAGSARALSSVGLIALILQTIVGAIARHANQSHALWTHVGNAFVVFLLLLCVGGFLVGRFAAIPGLRGLVRFLLILLVVQIALGFGALLVRTGKDPKNIQFLWRALLISSHVLIGALLTVTTSLLAAHVRRGSRSPIA